MLELPSARFGHLWWESSALPHIVAPRALTIEDSGRIAREFPPPSDSRWHTFSGPLEEGKQEGQASIAGENVARLHAELSGVGFMAWLREVSGVPDLIPDPLRVGGGIHQSGPGARLGMHVDFNVLPGMPDALGVVPLIRAVNVIVFVGWMPIWLPDWGGQLILGVDPEIMVLPLAGTFVAFEASDTSWHGHPTPMTAGAPNRYSVPAYYYRPIRDGEEIDVHSTRFLESA